MGKEKPFLIRAIREIRGQSLPFPFEQRTAGKKTTDHTDDTDGGELGSLFIRAIRVIRGQSLPFPLEQPTAGGITTDHTDDTDGKGNRGTLRPDAGASAPAEKREAA
jgi:hypothetical protein